MTLQEMTSARFKRGMKSNLGINSFYRFHIAVGIFVGRLSTVAQLESLNEAMDRPLSYLVLYSMLPIRQESAISMVYS